MISAPSQEKWSPEAEAGKHAARVPRPRASTQEKRHPLGLGPALLCRQEQKHLRGQLLIKKPAFLAPLNTRLQTPAGIPGLPTWRISPGGSPEK